MTTPYGQPLYPQYPMGSMGPVAERGRLACPPKVRLAWWLTLGGAMLFLVLVGISLAVSTEDIRDTVRQNLVADGTPFDEDDVRSGASGTLFILMFAAIVATAPFITFGALLRGGRNWTRVLLTVLVSIGGFVSLILMLPGYASLGLLIRLMALALAGLSITIVTLLFSARSNEFFNGPR